MKSFIKKIIKVLSNVILLFPAYYYDAKKYYKSAIYPFSKKYKTNEGAIIKLTHSIEKRISFENRDAAFGKQKAYRLLDMLEHANRNQISFNFPFDWATGTLHKYTELIQDNNEKKSFEERINRLTKFQNTQDISGGTFSVKREDVLTASQNNFFEFSLNRHSIRSFEAPADVQKIKKAIELAQKCPSTCNIQPIRTYLLNDKEKVQAALALQRGNRGFSEKIHQLIVITAKLSLYDGIRERNQCFVDGGIFALSLAYSLHYYGIGSCMLNWASTTNEELSLQSLAGIPKTERIILILPVGIIPENNLIPVSKRRPLDDVLKTLN